MNSKNVYAWTYVMAAESDLRNPKYKFIAEHTDYDLALQYTHNFSEFFHGKAIPNIFGKFTTYILDENSPGEKWPDFCLFSMGWALVSKKMRDAIERFTSPENYQWINATIGGINTPDYKLFNCLQHVKCMDMERSVLEFPSNQYVLRGKPLRDVSGPFRISEDPIPLMVTGNLHRYCLSEGLGPLVSEAIEVVD